MGVLSKKIWVQVSSLQRVDSDRCVIQILLLKCKPRFMTVQREGMMIELHDDVPTCLCHQTNKRTANQSLANNIHSLQTTARASSAM